MNTITRKYKLLKAVLASGCLMVPGAVLAGPIVNAPLSPGVVSAADDDTITITAGGSIQEAAANGINVTHKTNTINIDNAGAPNTLAIDINGGIDDAIDITNTATKTTVNIGLNRDITSINNGVVVGAADATINNDGLISAQNNHAISITANGKDATINNLSDGILRSSGTDVIDVDGEGVTIINAGTIENTTVGNNAIELKKNFESVTNNPGGMIKNVGGNGILVNGAAAVTGSIINTGTIEATGNAGQGKGINITGALTGSILNNQSAKIQTIGDAAQAIYLDNNITSIINNGTITATLGAQAIRADKNLSGNIINNSTGVIESAAGSAILLDNGLGGSITNSGTIKSATGIAVELPAGQITGSINNNTGGTIQAANNAAVKMVTTILDGAFSNSGTITNASAGNFTVDASLNGTFKGNFTNSGTIKNTVGGALSMDSIAINGTLSNAAGGTIEAANGEALNLSGVTIDTNFSNAGNILNNSADSALYIDDNTLIKGAFSNSGTIQNNGAAGKALEMDAVTINGNMTNSGTVAAVDENAILWNNTNIGGNFTNSGVIQNNSPGSATIDATGNTKIAGGFTNTGTIKNDGAGNAIDFSAAAVEIKLNQNGGAITGDVLLSGKGGDVFSMTGGTIDGDVTASNIAPNMLNLSGGTITQDLQLGAAGDTLHLSGTTVRDIIGGAGNDTVNITGGSFNTLAGAGVGNILNINSSFTTPGTIDNFQTINVNAGTFTVTQAITNVNAPGSFNILNDSTVIASGAGNIISGTGTLNITDGSLGILNGSGVNMGATTNDDYLGIQAGGLLTTTSYKQTPNGMLDVQIVAQNTFPGPYITTPGNAEIDPNSTLKLQVGGEFIPNNSTYNIINAAAAPGGYNLGTLTVVQPQSATVTFAPVLNGTNLDIVSTNIPFSTVVPNSDITNGVAGALDTIAAAASGGAATSPVLTELLGALQTLSTAEQVEDALRSLVPSYNNSIAANSNWAVRRAFDDIGIRFEELLGLSALLEGEDKYRDDENEDDDDDYYNPRYRYRDYNQGVSFGDGDGNVLMRHTYGTWIKPYASMIDQRKIDTIEGYRGDSVGFSMGSDWRILDWATIGAALSMGKTDLSQRGLYENKQKIDSYQLSFYGHFDPIGPIYVNSMLGLARHRYSVHRTISVGNLTRQAESSFHGLHYAAKFDIGYAWFNGKYYLSPLASMRFGRLDIDNYSEKGAGGLDLVVRTEAMNEIMGSIGLKVASKNEYLEATYIPELALFLNYDFKADKQETLNNFIAGGPSFLSFGIEPEQVSYVISPSFRMHTHRNMAFKIAYEFEAKKQYIAHTAYFKWYYKWA
ncbi:autotransporter domain-containing protein [Candidatus Berkiella cookevillensis]|uniref:Autotransporter domain-containing protein n=1 Tax=Candidatus Berkiella cookevillensis TaxID=437022 RepID=A0A0Q9YB17_9GAMM|nr:autotransporter domain-containing protein [Candidatus Berkiella cookevillensis]MCS5709011.1 autotransporter domain-containing protein [Candidatus Berkiella cookevillensis]